MIHKKDAKMIHSKMIHKKDTLKNGVVCCIHIMTVQERIAFVSFSHQFSKKLMMMKFKKHRSITLE